MTKDEALRLALEALSEAHYVVEHRQDVKKREQAITAIKAALEAKDEPVAWLHRFIEGGISIGLKPLDLERHPERWEPLYTEPKPCPTCEALSRTVMLDQTSHDTAPPQRTWVGLTDEETVAIELGLRIPTGYRDAYDLSLRDFAKAIEQALKERNT